MQRAFGTIYRALLRTAAWTGLTFEAVSVTAYYIILPCVVILLLDVIFGVHVLKIVLSGILLVFFLTVRGFQRFCIAVFDGSVEILRKLEGFGISYVRALVFLGIELPMMILFVLCVAAITRI
jgi:hypothetical protein